MTAEQAIELLQSSDLTEQEKQRLVVLVQEKGLNAETQNEILHAIKNAKDAVQAVATSVDERMEAMEPPVTREEKEMADEAVKQMDEAVADYNKEMATLTDEADQLAEDAKKA